MFLYLSLQRKKINKITNILFDSTVASQNIEKQNNEQYYSNKLYDIIEIWGIKQIIKNRTLETYSLLFVIPFKGFYDKLLDSYRLWGWR